jgi:hypothetical protein
LRHLSCTGPAILFPGIYGALLLDPLGLVLTPAISLDANGAANLVASVTIVPLLAGHRFAPPARHTRESEASCCRFGPRGNDGARCDHAPTRR